MIKKSLVAVLVILSASAASAQKNWLSLTISDYGQFSLQSRTDSIFTDIRSGLSLMPHIGYYRLIGDSWGAGCEFGYGKNDVQFSTYYLASPSLEVRTETKTPVTIIRIAPAIYELLRWKSFMITAMLKLPVSYSPRYTENYSYEQRDHQTQGAILYQQATTEFPAKLMIGVSGHIALQRRIIKQLYCGAQFGIAFYGSKGLGNTHEVDISTDASGTHSTTIETQNEKSWTSKIYFDPAFIISYYF